MKYRFPQCVSRASSQGGHYKEFRAFSLPYCHPYVPLPESQMLARPTGTNNCHAQVVDLSSLCTISVVTQKTPSVLPNIRTKLKRKAESELLLHNSCSWLVTSHPVLALHSFFSLPVGRTLYLLILNLPLLPEKPITQDSLDCIEA